MRVLYCTDTYPPQLNGVSVVTSLSVEGLSRRGWECAVVAPRYPEAGNAWGEQPTGAIGPIEVLSVPSVPLPRYPEVRLALPSPSSIHDLIKRFKPDLVHCATEFGVGRMGQIAAGRAGLPLVSSYHTDFARYAVAYGTPWLRGAVSSYLGRFHRRSRRVFTPSTISRQDLMRLQVANVEVWGRGVDAELFHPGRRSQAMRAALGMGSGFTFVYVGRLAPEKRPEQIIRAFRLASETLPRGVIHLIMAGTGPCEAELRATAPPGVTFLGYLDRRSRLPDLYANCDAFVFASVTETLGLVVLEAMASALPVVAAPAGGVRDHLRDGRNGLAYSPGDVGAMAQAMVRLAEDWRLTQRLAQGARRTAEALTWERELNRLDSSYREVCNGQETVNGNQHVTVV
ncbi:MAG: glycosyltransferase family 1 protein, partial [Gemmatimonadales bacterium]|nr:glycosyltransferase family 1 protein [Gemmatimonadales bacterium]